MKRISLILFGVSALSLIAGFSSTAYSLYINTNGNEAKDIRISLAAPEEEPLTDGAYYLVGNSDKYGNWNPIKSMELTTNPGNENERMITFTGSANDKVKVIRYHEGANCDWLDVDTGASGNYDFVSFDGDCVLRNTGSYTLYLDISWASSHGGYYKYWFNYNS